MSAEPLTREEVREWSTLAQREYTAGVSWAVLDRMIATVQAADERAERLRSKVEAIVPSIQIGTLARAMVEIRAALEADDAARGEG